LSVYENETKPVLEHYKKDKIVQIDATMSQLEVLDEIIKVLAPIKKELDNSDGARRLAELEMQRARR
jgi:hypothetical protein